jgi:indole-3-glycerol phosphate synthase
MINKVQIIAEVKTKSPFGFESDKTWKELFKIAESVGDIISIHTDPRWGGSFDLIKKAKDLTSKPILAKGIHSSDDHIIKALDNGADYVLVVGRIPKIHQDKCLIEPLNLSELKDIPSKFKVIWNSRDLSNGGFKKETFEQARKLWKGWLCQASNIKSVKDIKDGADAVLVGSHLENFIRSLKM